MQAVTNQTSIQSELWSGLSGRPIEGEILVDSARLADYDELHSLVVSEISGIVDEEARWGHLYLQNGGSEGAYEVSINGRFVGKNLKQRIPVPAGNSIILVRQSRPFGTQILAAESVEVVPGVTTLLNFAIPDLTALELSAFERLEKEAIAAWESDRESATSNVIHTLELLGSEPASRTLVEITERFQILGTDLERGAAPTQFSGPDPYGSSDSGLVNEILRPRIDTPSEEAASGAESESGVPSAQIERVAEPDTGADIVSSSGDDGADQPEEGGAGTTSPDRVTPAEIGLIGGVLRSQLGALLIAGGQIALDIGAQKQLFDPVVWESGSPGWGGGISQSLPQRLLVDYGGDYVYYALGAAFLLDTVLFPFNTLALSGRGKILYSIGFLLEAGGAVLGLLGRDLAFDAMLAERDLIEAESVSAELNTLYREKISISIALRVASYGAAGVGAIISLAAASATGGADPVVSGLGQGLLHSLGAVLGTAGSGAAYLALLFRAEAEYRWDRYEASGTSAEYEEYADSANLYCYATIGALGLCGGSLLTRLGAALMPHREEEARLSYQSYLSPGPGTVTLGFRIGAP